MEASRNEDVSAECEPIVDQGASKPDHELAERLLEHVRGPEHAYVGKQLWQVLRN